MITYTVVLMNEQRLDVKDTDVIAETPDDAFNGAYTAIDSFYERTGNQVLARIMWTCDELGTSGILDIVDRDGYTAAKEEELSKPPYPGQCQECGSEMEWDAKKQYRLACFCPNCSEAANFANEYFWGED